MTLRSFALSWGMIFVYVALNSYGAFVLKYQVERVGKAELVDLPSAFSYFFTLFASPHALSAIIALFGSTGAWIIALSRLNLSSAYPIAVGANFLIVVTVAVLFYNEPVSVMKVFGIILLMLGMILILKS